MTTATPPLLEHLCEVALRPNDFDRAGHLNNSVYLQLLETARWEWGIAHGVDARADTLVAMVLQLRLDYLRSVDWDPVGHVVVRTSLAAHSPYSFSLAQDVELRDGTVAARGRVRLALVDPHTKRAHRVDLGAMPAPTESPA
ncbi:acyl-CoA thioesterase [Streptomyces parvulus]|uniref:Acyl-CoA thioesterase n=1 Tax=Streptomyces parvulus TaxID=146923 RepID=A0A369V4M3_9ACTN|nr:acyl-CoA thioesterase [Streptomyces parvulus]RDD87701.1 acyl-CoA thioesterase [Streptomyces parvulus]